MFTTMITNINYIDPLLISVILAAILASLMTAPIGCIGLWNGLAFFGDTLAHASLLGICISLLLNNSYLIGSIGIGLLITLIIAFEHKMPKDVTLATISYSCLAISLLLITKFLKNSVDANALLFGDILSIQTDDLITLSIITIVLYSALMIFWRSILLLSFDEALAHVKQVPIIKGRLLLLFGYAIVIGSAMKVLGALFIPALVVIPAAASRHYARTPLQMILLTITISIVSSLSGVLLSIHFDLPTGPAIVAVNCCILVSSRFLLKVVKYSF